MGSEAVSDVEFLLGRGGEEANCYIVLNQRLANKVATRSRFGWGDTKREPDVSKRKGTGCFCPRTPGLEQRACDGSETRVCMLSAPKGQLLKPEQKGTQNVVISVRSCANEHPAPWLHC